MYLAMVKEWFTTLPQRFWRRYLMRSGLVTVFLLACVLAGLTIGYREHMRGNFHKLKAEMANARQDVPLPQPGGQEAFSLVRARLMGDSTPEFLSVTLLPGRGMNVLQISAYIPGKGEVNLLASPSLEDAAKAMTGKGEDRGGQASLNLGGAFDAPWAGRIWGTPAGGGQISTTWRGHTLTLPAAGSGVGTVARDGLMLAEASDAVQSTALPDGGDAQAVFHARDFGGHWPSKTDVTVTVLLSSRSIDLTMEAQNIGDTPEPIGLGWSPRFAILNGNRQQLRLRIPGEMRVELRNRDKQTPTGQVLPVAGTPYDFSSHSGTRLGTLDLNDCFVALHQDILDSGPIAEFSDPASNYGLRLDVLSPAIKAMRVVAPADGDFVSIGPQFNYPDPFGKEWKPDTDTGMVVLEPGQSTQWKVRIELFSLTGGTPPM
jgi:galactose mutarotase-like enzyme